MSGRSQCHNSKRNKLFRRAHGAAPLSLLHGHTDEVEDGSQYKITIPKLLLPPSRVPGTLQTAGSSSVMTPSIFTGRIDITPPEGIEGELWHVMGTARPGQRRSLATQWVTCSNRHLVVYSSLSSRSRIINALHFDALRIIFEFSHADEHVGPTHQGPATQRQQGLRCLSDGEKIPKRNKSDGTTGDSTSGRKVPQTPFQGLRSHTGNVLSRWYYFGVEFRERINDSSAIGGWRSHLMIFATSVRNDRNAWLEFFRDQEKIVGKQNLNPGESWSSPRNDLPKAEEGTVSSECNNNGSDGPRQVSSFFDHSQTRLHDSSGLPSVQDVAVICNSHTSSPSTVFTNSTNEDTRSLMEPGGGGDMPATTDKLVPPTENTIQMLRGTAGSQVACSEDLEEGLEQLRFQSTLRHRSSTPETPKKRKDDTNSTVMLAYRGKENYHLPIEGSDEFMDHLKVACDAVRELEERLHASEEARRLSEEKCERLQDDLWSMEADRMRLLEELECRGVAECALQTEVEMLQLRWREVLTELRDAEHQMDAAERLLCRSPEDVIRRVHAVNATPLSSLSSSDLPPGHSVRRLAERMGGLAQHVGERLERSHADRNEVLEDVLSGMCDDNDLARLQELRSAKVSAEGALRAALEDAELRLRLLTACNVVFNEDICDSAPHADKTQLLSALREDVAEVCGVPEWCVVNVSVASKTPHVVVVVVAHPCDVPAMFVVERVRACGFDRVRSACGWPIVSAVTATLLNAEMTEAAITDMTRSRGDVGSEGGEEAESVKATVFVGTPAAEAMAAHVNELNALCAVAERELRDTESALAERPRILREELETRVEELAASKEALLWRVEELSDCLSGADMFLRDAQSECGTLTSLLGIVATLGGSERACEGVTLTGGLSRVSESLKLSCDAVRELEERLHASEEARRLSEEKCERLQDDLWSMEADRMRLLEELECRGVAECALQTEVEMLQLRWREVQGAVDEAVENLCEVVLGAAASLSGMDDASEKHVPSVPSCEVLESDEWMARLVRLRVVVSVVQVVCRTQCEESRLQEKQGQLLRDNFQKLCCNLPELEAPTARHTVVKVMRELVSAVGTASVNTGRKEDIVGVLEEEDVVEVLHARYGELRAALLEAVEHDLKHSLCGVTEYIAGLQQAHDTLKEEMRDLRVALQGMEPLQDYCSSGGGGGDMKRANDAGEDEYDGDRDDEDGTKTMKNTRECSVAALVRQLQASVFSALNMLVSSVGGDAGVGLQFEKETSLSESIEVLRAECRLAAVTFSAVRSVLVSCGDARLTPSSGNANSCGDAAALWPVEGCYDDILLAVQHCIEQTKREREINMQLCGELQHVLLTTPSVGEFSTPSTSSELQVPREDFKKSETEENIKMESINPKKGDTSELAYRKAHLLLSMRELVDAGDADRETVASQSRASHCIVREVQRYIVARVSELQELRTAVVTSVEALGGVAVPSTADPHAAACALLAVVQETSESIDEVHELVSPGAVRHSPVRLRDLMGRLDAKVKEWEAGTRHVRELMESVMRVNDPSFALTAVPMRKLLRKEKPQPVSNVRVEEGLSLSRAFLKGSKTAEKKRGVGAENPAVCESPLFSGGAMEVLLQRTQTSATDLSESVGSVVSVQSMQEAVRKIRSKLIGIRHLTNACGAAVVLMGDNMCDSECLDALPVRLLQKAQEVHEVVQLMQEFLSHATEKEGTESVPGSLHTCVTVLLDVLKGFQNENEALRQQESAFSRQKAFLVKDIEEMRETFSKERKKMMNTHNKLLDERDKLQCVMDGATCKLQQLGADLDLAHQRCALLQEEFDRSQLECNQLEMHLRIEREVRNELQLSLVGLQEAAVMVNGASSVVYEHLNAVMLGFPDDMAITCNINRQETEGNATDAQARSPTTLLARSERTLRLCRGALVHFEHGVCCISLLRDWLLQVYAWAREDTGRSEGYIRGILHQCYRDEAALLTEKTHSIGARDDAFRLLQRRFEEAQQSHDNERVWWKRRLYDLGASEEKYSAVLHRRLSELRRRVLQHDSVQSEVTKWRARTKVARKKIGKLKKEYRKLLVQPVRVTAREERGVMTEHNDDELDCMLSVVALISAVGGGTRGDALPLQVRLLDAVQRARQLSDGVARCRALLQDQLVLLGDDTATPSRSRSKPHLIALTERHRMLFEKCMNECRSMAGHWQEAQDKAFRLQCELHESEQQHLHNVQLMEQRITELRLLVQKKIRDDQIAEKHMEKVELALDQHLAAMHKHTAEDVNMTQQAVELRQLLRARSHVWEAHGMHL